MKLVLFLLLFSLSAFAQKSKINELERRMNILAEEIQMLKANQLQVSQNTSVYGLGNSASKVYRIKRGVSIGGYGEIVFHQDQDKNESDVSGNKSNKSEMLRNIIYLGYKFNDQWVLNTEIEIEHVNEIYTEFAFLDYLHSPELNFRTGLVLIPLGIVNEAHEPTMFNSVNRPELENKLIPSTWRELGIGVFGTIGKIDYRAYFVNSLDGNDIGKAGIRNGRKKGGATDADDPENQNTDNIATTGRVDYNVNRDLTVGLGFYYGSTTNTENEPSVGVAINELHAKYQRNALYANLLFVNIDIDGAQEYNSVDTTALLADKMHGGYIEVGYDFYAHKTNKSLIPFIRYEHFNTHDEVGAGITQDKSLDKTNITVGVAYKPLQQIVFKADYIKKTNDAETGVDQFNLGLGYNF